MLSIHLGDYPGSIYDTETYFRNSYLDSWFEDPMAAQIIKSVDGSELIGPHNIVSKQLGSITPLELSGGVKTLLLVRNLPNMVFNASTCGDNCARWLLKIGKKQDVLVTLYHIMKFPGRILKSALKTITASSETCRSLLAPRMTFWMLMSNEGNAYRCRRACKGQIHTHL